MHGSVGTFQAGGKSAVRYAQLCTGGRCRATPVERLQRSSPGHFTAEQAKDLASSTPNAAMARDAHAVACAAATHSRLSANRATQLRHTPFGDLPARVSALRVHKRCGYDTAH